MSDLSQQTRDLETTAADPQLSMSSVGLEPLFRQRLLDPPMVPGDAARIDGFSIIRQIGQGGMGLVFLARRSDGGDEVAVKVITPQLVNDPRSVHRFLNEARHMSRLKHPNILKVLEVCDRPHGPYYVMPYMSHGSLAKLLAPGKPLETHFILRVASGLVQALAHAHDKGIIHRDLKPANLMMDGEGNVYLSDFGLVRTVFNDSILDVHANQCEGTAAYMSPAVARGAAEDTRCDIYSFGAILYEMLTGQPPYEGRSSQEVRARILSGPPVRTTKLNPQAHPQLVRIAETAMGRELRDRYARMEDIATDLTLVERGKPASGLRGRRIGNASKWMIAAGIAVAAAATILIIAKIARPHREASGAGASPIAQVELGAVGDLFISSNSDGRIMEFNPTSRKFVGVFAIAQPGTKPSGLAFAHNGNLYVNNSRPYDVGLLTEYNGSTGAFIVNVAEPFDGYGLAISGESIYVAESGRDHQIHEYSYNGVPNRVLTDPLMKLPLGVAFGPDSNLYVTNRGTSAVIRLKLDGPGPTVPRLAVLPKHTESFDLAFGPDGTLFATDFRGNSVIGFEAVTGKPLRTITGQMDGPSCIAFDQTGNLWVSNLRANTLNEYDFKTGQLMCSIAGPQLNAPMYIAVKPRS